MQPGQGVSRVAPAFVGVSVVSHRLCRTASSGHLKINYQIAVKRNSSTITENEKGGKKTAGKRKEISFTPNYFHQDARAYKTGNWQEPPPCSSSLLDTSGKAVLELDDCGGWKSYCDCVSL